MVRFAVASMGQQGAAASFFHTGTRPVLLASGESDEGGRRDAPAPDDDAPSSSSSERQSFLARLREAVFDSDDKAAAGRPGTTTERASKKRARARKMSRTVMDVDPVASDSTQSDTRLEWIKLDHKDEFPQMTAADKTRRHLEASKRILTIAYERVFDPRIVKIVLGSCTAVVTLGFAEASLLCNGVPFCRSPQPQPSRA